MNRTQSRPIDTARTLMRVALLMLALSVPMIAMQQVQAGTSTIIEDTYKRSSGAGLVILVSLQRA